jgi:hypothetical protein
MRPCTDPCRRIKILKLCSPYLRTYFQMNPDESEPHSALFFQSILPPSAHELPAGNQSNDCWSWRPTNTPTSALQVFSLFFYYGKFLDFHTPPHLCSLRSPTRSTLVHVSLVSYFILPPYHGRDSGQFYGRFREV